MDFTSGQGLTWRARMVALNAGMRIVEDQSTDTFHMARDGTLVTPVLDVSDPDRRVMLAGGTFHEALHFAESDFSVLDACTPIERNYFMILEDLRIERDGSAKYTGGAADLKAFWSALYRRGMVSRPDPAVDDLLHQVGCYLLAYARFEALGLPEAQEDMVLGREILQQRLPAEELAELDAVLALSRVMATSRDALEIARRLLAKFVNPEDLAYAPPKLAIGSDDGSNAEAGAPQGDASDAQSCAASQPDSQPANPAQQAAGPSVGSSPHDESPANGAREGSGDQADPAAQEPASGSNAGQQGSSPVREQPGPGQSSGDVSPDGTSLAGAAEGDQGDSKAASCSSGGDPAAPPQAHALEQQAPRVSCANFTPVAADPAEMVNDYVAISNVAGDGGGGAGTECVDLRQARQRFAPPSAGAVLLATAKGESMALRARLSHLLKAASEEQVRFATRGRLRAARLWRLRTGDAKVFEDWTEAPLESTLVSILADRSDSTKGYVLGTELKVAAALCLGMEGITGVKTSVHYFPAAPQAIGELKTPEQTTQRVCGNLASLKAKGGTPTGAALTAMLPVMQAVDVERRLLLVITDGKPDCVERTRTAARRLERAGIEVVFVGIGCDVSHLGGEGIRIDNVGDLAKALGQYLQRRLAQVLRQAA